MGTCDGVPLTAFISSVLLRKPCPQLPLLGAGLPLYLTPAEPSPFLGHEGQVPLGLTTPDSRMLFVHGGLRLGCIPQPCLCLLGSGSPPICPTRIAKARRRVVTYMHVRSTCAQGALSGCRGPRKPVSLIPALPDLSAERVRLSPSW